MSLVLAVDDSPVLLGMLVKCLREGGHEVVTAVDGKDALEKLKQHQPEIVVTDLNMPVMTGLDFIEAARAEPEGQGVPMLLLTSETAADLHARSRSVRATAWLQKPLNGPQLLALVADLI